MMSRVSCLLALTALLVGCSSTSPRLSGEGESCTKTLDCEPSLVCRSLICTQMANDGGVDEPRLDTWPPSDGSPPPNNRHRRADARLPAAKPDAKPPDAKPPDAKPPDAKPPDAKPVSGMLPINVVYYGFHNTTVDSQLIAAKPEILISNTPAGPWKGNCNSAKFQAAGIKVFSYIDGGYEHTVARSIPNDLTSNLAFIDAIANEGTYGVFLDEVSSSPNQAGHGYLAALSNKAKSRGVKLICNTGVTSWDAKLMSYCDYMQSSEQYAGANVTSTMLAYPGRVMMLTEQAPSLTAAVSYTKAAWSKGIKYHYATTSYMALPAWFKSYVASLKASSP